MSSWLADYSSALDVRDKREKALESYISAYTKLADRTASLENEATVFSADAPLSATATVSKDGHPGTPGKGKQVARDNDNSPEPSSDLLSRLRVDLASTQRVRSTLESKLGTIEDEVKGLRTQTTTDAKRIAILERDKAVLERKVRDRDEEIKGKARLVEDVQDEMITLNLQLNMAEQNAAKLEKENGMLVERWMKRVGEEADQLNEASKW